MNVRSGGGHRGLLSLLAVGAIVAVGGAAAVGAFDADDRSTPAVRDQSVSPSHPATQTADAEEGGTDEVGVAPANTNDTVSALFVGDSLADLLARDFVPQLGYDNLEVHTVARPGCGLSGGVIAPQGGDFGQQDCTDWVERWTYGLEVFKPDIVVLLTGTWEVFDRVIDGHPVSFDDSAEYYTSQLDKALALVKKHGARLVVLSQPCNAAQDNGNPYPFDERFVEFNKRNKAWAEMHAGDVVWVDLAGFVCPLSKWDSQLDGNPFYPDDIHFSEQSADIVWDWLAPTLVNTVTGTVGGVTDTVPVTTPTLP